MVGSFGDGLQSQPLFRSGSNVNVHGTSSAIANSASEIAEIFYAEPTIGEDCVNTQTSVCSLRLTELLCPTARIQFQKGSSSLSRPTG
jgi:hypothetical protein